MPDLTTVTYRATVHALTHHGLITDGWESIPAGVIVEPQTDDGLLPADPDTDVVVIDGTGRIARVSPGMVQLVTGPAVIVRHLDGYSTVLPCDTTHAAERMGSALDDARPVLPAVSSVRVVEIFRQH